MCIHCSHAIHAYNIPHTSILYYTIHAIILTQTVYYTSYIHIQVVSYRYITNGVVYGDKYDDTEGHGTHVSGTVAGYSLNNYGDPQKYDGKW